MSLPLGHDPINVAQALRGKTQNHQWFIVLDKDTPLSSMRNTALMFYPNLQDAFDSANTDYQDIYEVSVSTSIMVSKRVPESLLSTLADGLSDFYLEY